LVGLFLYPEDGGDMLLRAMGGLLLNYIVTALKMIHIAGPTVGTLNGAEIYCCSLTLLLRLSDIC
jgi:hypothetical protein